MQRPQFGQRGAMINGEPVNQAASARRTARPTSSDVDEPVNWLKIIGIVFVVFMLLAWLEALLAGTALITPISQTLLWSMRSFGLVVGLVVTVLTVLTMTDASLLRRGLTVLVCPLLIAFAFGEIAYRITDWTEFGFSSQQFESAQYPIESISSGRKGARNTIRIDPFDTGDSTNIPVTKEQYHELREASANSCVTVMQRKSASGAIEIVTNGRFMLNTPEPVPVSICGLSPVAPTATTNSASNPWSKN